MFSIHLRAILILSVLFQIIGGRMIVSAQQWDDLSPSDSGFDLKLTSSELRDDALILKWFPHNTDISTFRIQVTEIESESVRHFDAGTAVEFLLDSLETGIEYEVRVFGYDLNLNEIAISIPERFVYTPATERKLVPSLVPRKYTSDDEPYVTLDLLAVNSGMFPYVKTNIRLTTSGLGEGAFDSTNFSIFEDSRLQLNVLEVTGPYEFNSVREVDFVFIIDNSGSMEPEHQDVWDNIENFANTLEFGGVDLQLGLVRFGQADDWGKPILVNSGHLTDSVAIFKDWLLKMTADGGFEPSLEAVFMAATEMKFRDNAFKHFLLITDEDSDLGDLQKTIDVCRRKHIVVHCAVDISYGDSYNQFGRPDSSLLQTGGRLFPVLGPYDEIFDTIIPDLAATYILRYRTDNPIKDGKKRKVVVEFTNFQYTAADTGYYIPGDAPRIRRTPETIALSDSMVLKGSTIPIAALITDAVPPPVQIAWLYYRALGETNYDSTKMILQRDSLYSADIPGAAATSIAVEYYITAADSYITSSDPDVKPSYLPYQIPIYPNPGPKIEHEVIDTAYADYDIEVVCSVTDSTNYVKSVTLEFRKKGTSSYTTFAMKNTHLDAYYATIPAAYVTTEGVEYCIYAEDDMGIKSSDGTHDDPHYIVVVQMDLPETIVIEAEEMQNRKWGNPCENGWRMTHQDQPLYEYIDFGKSKYWRFTVIARAEIGNDIAPWLKVKIGTVFNGNVEVSNEEWQEYSFVTAIPEGNHRFDLIYINDWWNGYDDRNLLIDKTIIEPQIYRGGDNSYTFEAEKMTSYANGHVEDGYWKFDCGGYLTHRMYFERRSLTFDIFAKSDSSEGGWPQIDLYLGGIFLGSALVNSSSEMSYRFSIPEIEPGAYYFDLYYRNHVWKRGLYIDKVVFYVNDTGLLKPREDVSKKHLTADVLPDKFAIAQNYPNPFNPGTKIAYQLPEKQHVVIKIYNCLGEQIRILTDKIHAPGWYEVFWDGLDRNGVETSSGLYLITIRAGEFTDMKKMIKIK
ncbi:T9SS type A sorting domain-containing protein [candidate division KSB1 bacterium]|nr:T9SS type A sorting domain-containing protein [candidate division KSB1 bacterium]